MSLLDRSPKGVVQHADAAVSAAFRPLPPAKIPCLILHLDAFVWQREVSYGADSVLPFLFCPGHPRLPGGPRQSSAGTSGTRRMPPVQSSGGAMRAMRGRCRAVRSWDGHQRMGGPRWLGADSLEPPARCIVPRDVGADGGKWTCFPGPATMTSDQPTSQPASSFFHPNAGQAGSCDLLGSVFW